MLEIFLVIHLAKKLGVIVEEKGRKKVGFIVMFVLLWIIGEITGGVVAAATMASENMAIVYVYAIIGAGIGTAISFLIVNNLKRVRIDENGRTVVVDE